MGMPMRKVGVGLGLMIGAVCLAREAEGAGFQVPSQGARAAGQADAFVAQADDPSAIHYNPAGLTQLRGTQVMAGLYAVYLGFEFEGAAGDEHTTTSTYLPHFYAVTDFGLKDLRFGLGASNVHGLREDWGDTGAVSQIVTHSDLEVIAITPSVAWRINEHWSVGAGLNVYHGEFEHNNRVVQPGLPDGSFRIDGNANTVGGTAGVLWEIDKRNSIGAVYRSRFELGFEGHASISIPGVERIGPSETAAEVDFPDIIVVGYAYRPIEPLKLEFDVQWANWETVGAVKAHSKDPRFEALPPRVFDWEGSFVYRLGMEYWVARSWALRAGYEYGQSAAPGDTFTPLVTDLTSHIFTAGLGYRGRGWDVDVAYRFILGVERDVNHSINSPPGEYSGGTSTVMVSLTLKF